MKFGRKARTDQAAKAAKAEASETGASESDALESDAGDTSTPDDTTRGPWDISEIDEDDDVERIDLGGILIPPVDGMSLRIQIDERSGEVQSVLVGDDEGAVEVRAFAAPRNGSIWADVRREVAAETSRAGGTATEREGNRGTELVCEVQVTTQDGRTGIQPSRVVGIDGNRWFLRATFLGKPAVEEEPVASYEAILDQIVVRRGHEAMAPGEALEIVVPADARRVE